MGSLFEELAQRETAAGVRVEELETRIAELSGVLAVERERLSRLAITRETLAELAAEMPVSPELPGSSGLRERVVDGSVEPAALTASSPLVGVLTVPHREPGMDLGVLPADYRDIVEVVADAPGPIRAKQVVPRVGLVVPAGKIEGTRSKLKRLVARGWLAGEVPGLFTPAVGDPGRSRSG